jgi:CheY-like chemotaxis protein
MRILVIDDDAAMRRTVGMILDSAGYEHVLVESVPDGLAAAEESRFDVALTDMNMPGLDGLEAVKAFSQMKPPLVVVAMSGGSAKSSTEDYSVLALRLGARAFLGKPFKRAQLIAAIAQATQA